MTRVPTVVAVLALSFTACNAFAEDVTVTQENKAFSTKNITIKVGDSITFVKSDSVTHNVYSRSKGNKFDSGTQTPNSSMSQVFPKIGKVKVCCAIHPRMKLTVHIE